MKKLETLLISLLTIVAVSVIVCIGYCVIFDAKIEKPKPFKYNGHDYIKFSNGVVHSPDCEKCYGMFD